jgi:ABC-type sugar transport system ATPase subunit
VARIAFGLKLRHTTRAEISRRVGEAAEMLGLGPYLNRKPARSAVRPGARVDLAIDTSRLHFFAPVTGESIGHEPKGLR